MNFQLAASSLHASEGRIPKLPLSTIAMQLGRKLSFGKRDSHTLNVECESLGGSATLTRNPEKASFSVLSPVHLEEHWLVSASVVQPCDRF